MLKSARRATALKDEQQQLRVWFRLLVIHKTISNEIRGRFRSEFAISTPRFDVLAQLHGAEDDITMGAISQKLMVTTGNITGLIDGMVADGLVERRPHGSDRRSILISLTPEGRALFERMAPLLSEWMSEAMAELSSEEIGALLDLLGKLKHSADHWK